MLVRCLGLGEVGRAGGDAQGWRAGWQVQEGGQQPLTCLNLGDRPVFLGGHGPCPLPGTGQSPTWHRCQETWQAAAGPLGHTVLSLFWALPVPLCSWPPGEVRALVQQGQRPFSGLQRPLSAPHLQPVEPPAGGGRVSGPRWPEDCGGGTLMPLQGARPLTSVNTLLPPGG